MYGKARYGKRKFGYTSKTVVTTRGNRSGRKKAGYTRRNIMVKVPTFRHKWQNSIPQKGYFKFRYQDSKFDMSTSGAFFSATHVFSGNSLYDPDVTGIGVQPYAFDNMVGANAPYNKYIVYASKIRIYPKITEEDPNVVRAIRWLVVPSRAAVPTYQEFEDLCQMPLARRFAINSIDDCNQKITNYSSTARTLTEARDLSGTQYMGDYTSNPNQPWTWFVYTDSYDAQRDVRQVMDVQITYYAKLFKSDDINES